MIMEKLTLEDGATLNALVAELEVATEEEDRAIWYLSITQNEVDNRKERKQKDN